jgi:intracellular sulfur oxidation DsrE/DsrF family protein
LAKKFHNKGGKVYVVASANGIDLLRSRTSPHKLQIKHLTDIYPELDFVACNNTLDQYKKAGKSVGLIDSAIVAPSAVEFVVSHLQKGWQYIAI